MKEISKLKTDKTMNPDNKLLEYLACPHCKSELKANNQKLECSGCGLEYDIINGIFDLYPKENEFTARQIDLDKKYNLFGQSVSRPTTLQESRRRKITIELVNEDDVLEIGCAEGWMSLHLSEKFRNLFCADIAFSYLERAKQEVSKAIFIRMDAHYLPFRDEALNSILMTEVLEHLISPYRALDEIHRILKPSGSLILSVPNNFSMDNYVRHLFNSPSKRYSAHLNFYDVHSIINLLRFVGFETENIMASSFTFPGSGNVLKAEWIQNILTKLFRNFGDKIVLKANKTDRTLWDEL